MWDGVVGDGGRRGGSPGSSVSIASWPRNERETECSEARQRDQGGGSGREPGREVDRIVFVLSPTTRASFGRQVVKSALLRTVPWSRRKRGVNLDVVRLFVLALSF